MFLTGLLRKKQLDRLLHDERPRLEREKQFRVFNPRPPSGHRWLAVNVVGAPVDQSTVDSIHDSMDIFHTIFFRKIIL
jgi:hypothetical protein